VRALPTVADLFVTYAPARACIAAWSSAGRVGALDLPSARAHQRLLREFLQEHLAEGRPLHAFDVWERGAWQLQ